jgi:hypothetical protein
VYIRNKQGGERERERERERENKTSGDETYGIKG